MGLTRLQALRRWLFQLCQNRSGQCLKQQPKNTENL